MNCVNHQERDAKAICKECVLPICEECKVQVGDQTFCKGCVAKKTVAGDREDNHTNMNRDLPRGGVLQFFVSLVPGLGQMYNGAMRRGVELIIIFAVALAFSESFMGEFSWLLGTIGMGVVMAIYFFSFFDSYQVRRMRALGMPEWNKPILPGEGTYFSKDVLEKFKQSQYLGWGLILVGGLMSIPILKRLLYIFIDYRVATIIDLFLSLIIPIALICIGWTLIRGEKRTSYLLDEEDE